MIKVGSIFSIPLSSNKFSFCQYAYHDAKFGTIIQVFSMISPKKDINICLLEKSGFLFPPVFAGLKAAVKMCNWEVIGFSPIENFIYPKFVSAVWDSNSGIVSKWFTWDGSSFTQIGGFLPDELKRYEYLAVWSPFDIAERIDTGKYPFPYNELILNNRIISSRDDS